MSSEIEKHAADQANTLGLISPESYENNPAAAFEIMSHVIAMTKIPIQVNRHKYGQEILRNLGANFYNSYNRPFRNRISNLISLYQELPNFNNYALLDLSNEDLVSKYIRVRRTVIGMTVTGFGAAGNEVKKRGKGAIDGAKGVILDSAKQFKLPDSSDVWAGARKGAGPMPKSPVHALVWVVGYAAYGDVSRYKERLSNEIKRRWKNKMLPRNLYEEAFSSVMFGAEQFLPENLRVDDETENLKIERYQSPIAAPGELP